MSRGLGDVYKRQAVEDAYYMDMDDDAANAAIREMTPASHRRAPSVAMVRAPAAQQMAFAW